MGDQTFTEHFIVQCDIWGFLFLPLVQLPERQYARQKNLLSLKTFFFFFLAYRFCNSLHDLLVLLVFSQTLQKVCIHDDPEGSFLVTLRDYVDEKKKLF